MKKLLIILLFCSSAYAERNPLGRVQEIIEPAVATSSVTIAAPGSNLINCLTMMTVISGSTYTARILNGTTTSYSVLMPASTQLQEKWNLELPYCSDVNRSMAITVDNGTYSINYGGVIIKQ